MNNTASPAQEKSLWQRFKSYAKSNPKKVIGAGIASAYMLGYKLRKDRIRRRADKELREQQLYRDFLQHKPPEFDDVDDMFRDRSEFTKMYYN